MEAETQRNKKVIGQLYDNVLNNRRFHLAEEIVSPNYTSPAGEKGVVAFTKGMIAVTKALPDAHWTLDEIVAEGNKVVVRQNLTGTHQGYFQGIPPTNRPISNSGFVVYELEDGKIVHHHIQTDRLTFLQQVGVLPNDLSILTQGSDNHAFFVDKFRIPKDAIAPFRERMNYNRDYIKTLPGFVRDEVIAQQTNGGDLLLMTIAEWKSQQHLDEAKKLVQAEYHRTNFNAVEFTGSLGIQMERELYYSYQ